MRHGSLFSGIGGFDLAAQWMNWENVFHCEWVDEKRKQLEHYWPNAKSYGDISKTDFTIHSRAIDVLTGGFPCQDISVSNSKSEGVTGKRSGLWSEFHRAIEEINPPFVIIENSPQLLRKGFEKVLYDLSTIGYNAEWKRISAAALGFPHERKRLFIVAYSQSIRPYNFSFFKEFHLESIKQGVRDTPTIYLEAIGRTYPQLAEDLLLDDGVPESMAQIKSAIHGYGNAVVPQVVLQIFKAIEQYEKFI